jgi:glutaminyl-peptide cyclotransferase
MRKLGIFFLSVLFGTFVLLNCAQSSKGTRKPVTSINITGKHNGYRAGDRLTVNIKTKVKDGSFRNTEIFLDGNSLTLSDKNEFTLEIKTENLRVGTHYLKALATNNEGLSGENFSDFILLSDIEPQKFSYKIIKSFPHNINNFTEGLEIRNGFLYEGTGQEGSSAIYKTDLSNWRVIKEYKMESQYFGEGITVLNGKLYQLTYKSQIGFVRNPDTFELLKSWYYKNAQGWGLTNDGKSLIMSDGTDFIYYLDPVTFKEIKKIQVCNYEGIVTNINELEYINNEIWANIWMTDKLVKIDPETGKVKAEIDLSGLLASNLMHQKSDVDVLNGIAYDQNKNKLYVTGKLWPKLFEIEIISNNSKR